MVEVRQLWLSFCETYLDLTLCNKAMILLSSCVYNVLLDHIHSQTMKSLDINSTVTQYNDGEDVYFRFGGAAISDMLHLRYRNIKTCSATRKEVISLEIEILHAMNTKDVCQHT